MSEERAFIAILGDGEIRWVIDRTNGTQEWHNPQSPNVNNFEEEWAALWSKASRTQLAIDGEEKFQTYKTKPWLATRGMKK